MRTRPPAAIADRPRLRRFVSRSKFVSWWVVVPTATFKLTTLWAGLQARPKESKPTAFKMIHIKRQCGNSERHTQEEQQLKPRKTYRFSRVTVVDASDDDVVAGFKHVAETWQKCARGYVMLSTISQYEERTRSVSRRKGTHKMALQD